MQSITNSVNTNDWLAATKGITISSYIDKTILESKSASPSGGFEIVYLSPYPVIDTATHQDLLEQSLREYIDIWRDLSQR